jgi:hypothetical protein
MNKKDAMSGLIIFGCTSAIMWVVTSFYFLLNSVNYNAPTTLGLIILMVIIGLVCGCLTIAGYEEVGKMEDK